MPSIDVLESQQVYIPSLHTCSIHLHFGHSHLPLHLYRCGHRLTFIMSDRSYGLWGHLSFGWVDGPIKKARKNELELENLYLPKAAEAAKCYSEFEQMWASKTDPNGKKLKNPLLSSLWALYGKQFLLGGFFKLGWSFFVISGAFFFVRSLLMYVDEDEDDHPFTEDWTGWPLAIGFFVASVLWGMHSSNK